MVGVYHPGTAGHTKGTLFTRRALYFNSTLFSSPSCAFIRIAGIVRGSVGGDEGDCINNHFPLHHLSPLFCFVFLALSGTPFFFLPIAIR